ncbi:MAG: hypothetical protein AAF492_05185, partial [Verrucomicrobiota bacterium]
TEGRNGMNRAHLKQLIRGVALTAGLCMAAGCGNSKQAGGNDEPDVVKKPETVQTTDPVQVVEKKPDPDPVKPDPVKPDPVKPDPVKPEPVKPDPVKPDPVKPEPPKPEVVQPEPEPPAEQKPDIEALVRSGDPERIKAAIQWALGLEGAERENAVHEIAALLMSDDPGQAFELLGELAPGGRRDNAMRSAVTAVYKSNPDEAVRQALNLDAEEEGEARNYLIKSLALAFFPDQIQQAMQLVIQLPPGPSRNTLVAVMGSQVAQQGIDEVEAWIELLIADDIRAAGLFASARTLFGKDQTGVQEWISTLPEGPQRDAAMAGMAAALLGSDLDRAQTLILGLEEGLGRENGMAELATQLTRQDVESAEAWIKGLPAGRSRDRAYQSHILGRCQASMKFRPELVEQIVAPDIRTQLETDVAIYLLKTDPTEESAQWVRNSSLSDEEKGRLLKLAGF